MFVDGKDLVDRGRLTIWVKWSIIIGVNKYVRKDKIVSYFNLLVLFNYF